MAALCGCEMSLQMAGVTLQGSGTKAAMQYLSDTCTSAVQG
jgi:hypothetical protein